jgi:endonuclease/exonuclease/phosphatase family metal-dependent hydrolase
VKGKPEAARKQLADRIKSMDVDVFAVQEVEDIDTLRRFNAEDLDHLYRTVVLIEGNDPRLIDVAVLSKLPIGAVTSWQHMPDPAHPDQHLFSRDLLQVEILKQDKTLLALFVNHLKSQYVPFGEDQALGTKRANELRSRQAEGIVRVLEHEMNATSRYVVLGDMNDTPDSQALKPLADSNLHLANGLTNPTETRPPKHDDPPPHSSAWTHRFKEAHKPASYELLDQIWLSPALAAKEDGSWIDRRTKNAGDGSDHDPAWVSLGI